ncbi:FCP1-like domain, HAD-like domain protein [Artemisia annua]|uniref:Mitochondrial import inner membrane translocase subunit TIM50 n=1 Tax=Artemisia annua TaxID=35608 RepID=A0A2U1MU47_ARTAN|nr:FCP1-like domain, HAD-like domain protein [Artemisia annua]
MATKESKLKNLVVNKCSSSNKDANEKDTGSVWPFPWIKLSVPKKKDKKITDAVASDDSHIDEKQENEKEARIDQGISLDKLSILGRKKKLLVLPLGGIIVHRAHRIKPHAIPKNREPDFLYVYKRPYCEEFLKFCLERFEVGIWSSAREQNIQWVLANVVGELKSKILFTWDQNQCIETRFKCLDNTDKPVFIKELRHLWDNKYSNLPWREGEYSSSNTLLITAPVKALLNPPNTGIFPQNYDPENKEDDFLGPDGELRVFLNGLAEATDVPTYVKDHRIGQPPITNSHPDWAYYSKVIRSINGRLLNIATLIEQMQQSTPEIWRKSLGLQGCSDLQGSTDVLRTSRNFVLLAKF